MLKAEASHFGLAEVVPGDAHLVECTGFGVSILKDFKLRDRLLEYVDRLRGIVDEDDVGRTKIRKSQSLATAVLEFAEDGEGLIQALDTFLLVVEREVRQARVVERGAAPCLVRWWIKAERIAVIPTCLFGESPAAVFITDMRNGSGLVRSVTKFMPNGTSGLELLNGFLLLAQGIVGVCDGAESVGLGFAVSGFAGLVENCLH